MEPRIQPSSTSSKVRGLPCGTQLDLFGNPVPVIKKVRLARMAQQAQAEVAEAPAEAAEAAEAADADEADEAEDDASACQPRPSCAKRFPLCMPSFGRRTARMQPRG